MDPGQAPRRRTSRDRPKYGFEVANRCVVVPVAARNNDPSWSTGPFTIQERWQISRVGCIRADRCLTCGRRRLRGKSVR